MIGVALFVSNCAVEVTCGGVVTTWGTVGYVVEIRYIYTTIS